jgi:hypothetical protein
MESTNRKLTLNGVQEYRVWEGITEDGIPFIALVNRCQVRNPAQSPQFIEALTRKSKDEAPETPAVLEAMGITPV